MEFGQRMYSIFRADADQILGRRREWEQLPLWPLVCCLRRVGYSDAFSRPGRLARTWLRWRTPHRASRRHSGEDCRRGLSEALTLEARLSWLLLLLEGHRDRAVDELLPLLRHRDEELVDLAAMGLGQLGRQILPDLEERWGCARLPERDAICQTLCYLGPLAHGCLPWLGEHDRPWGRALFCSMEQHGWPALLSIGGLPIWLDEASLERLAGLVFSTRAEERERALEPLAGWGPGRAKAAALLRVLTQDEDPLISQRALAKFLDTGLELDTLSLQRALLNANDSLQLAATRALVRQNSEWAEFHQLSEMAMGGHLQRQKAQFHSRELWSPEWADEVLVYLAEHAVPDQELAARLQVINEVSLQVYLKLHGPVRPLVEQCQHAPSELARVIFDELVRRECWAEVLECLSRSELLEVFCQEYRLMYLLHRRSFDQLTRFEHHLRLLAQGPDASVVSWSARLLSQLDLSQVRWEEWPRLEKSQTDTLFLLMEWRDQFPDELVREIQAGRLFQPPLVAALVRSRHDAEDILWACYDHCPPEERAQIAESLRQLGNSSWVTLWELLLKGVEGFAPLTEALARHAGSQRMEQLLNWGPGQLPGPLPKLLALTLAEALLHSGAPLDQRRFAWARRLADDAHAGHCPIYYLFRSGGAGLAAVLELFRHPDPRVRYGVIVCARFAYADWVWLLRSQPADPDPENQMSVLEHLHAKVGLTELEWVQLEELVQVRETSPRARVLLEGRRR